MTATGREVAIVGFTLRLPGARNAAELWDLLSNGREGIRRLSEEDLVQAGVPLEDVRHPDYVPAAGVVDGVELFDARFFQYPARLAQALDPQQRILLECSWEALEHAGCDPGRFAGSIGVFAGQSENTYLDYLREVGPDIVRALGERLVRQSNDPNHLAGRIAYKLDLHGPALTVLTACSTSLVAIHLACQSLLAGECDVALAGAASFRTPQVAGYFHDGGRITSPNGRCKAFDAEADGCVQSGGAAAVVLKPLDRALEDGDLVHSVIKGSAINNDGSDKVGYAAPSINGQTAVIAEALSVAGVDVDSIAYVEAHGTGTPAGDPIELAALVEAYGNGNGRPAPPRALGSIKTNIGHADTAAGVAGLLKVVLALKHRRIPPSLHFTRPNPELPLEGSGFYVNTTLAPWPTREGPRRAGVSSFGLGGTNAHLVVEEPPPAAPSAPPRSSELLVVSAATPEALRRRRLDLAAFLDSQPETNLGDLAFVLQTGRRQFQRRWAAACRNPAEARRQLREGGDGRAAADDVVVLLLFEDARASSFSLSPDLFEDLPQLRGRFDELREEAESILGSDGFRRADGPLRAAVETLMGQLTVAHALKGEWNVRPSMLVGAGAGELAAAAVAGAVPFGRAVAALAAEVGIRGATPDRSRLWSPVEDEAGELEAPVICVPMGLRLPDQLLDQDAIVLPQASHVVVVRLGRGLGPAGSLPRQQGRPLVEIADLDEHCDLHSIHCALAALWTAGAVVDFEDDNGLKRHQTVECPTYPFERVRYWPRSAMAKESNEAGDADGRGPTAPAERTEREARRVEPATTTMDRGGQGGGVVTAPAVTGVTPVASALSEIFADLLGVPVEEVDRGASFLELGLDSLMLLQASQTVRQQLGVDVPFRQLLRKYSTVEKLAAFVAGADAGGNRDSGAAPGPGVAATASAAPRPPAAPLDRFEAPPRPDGTPETVAPAVPPAAEVPGALTALAAPPSEPISPERVIGEINGQGVVTVMELQARVLLEQITVLRGLVESGPGASSALLENERP
jgi:acyl transferase domain-containing protein